jgi:hypothetical protein
MIRGRCEFDSRRWSAVGDCVSCGMKSPIWATLSPAASIMRDSQVGKQGLPNVGWIALNYDLIDAPELAVIAREAGGSAAAQTPQNGGAEPCNGFVITPVITRLEKFAVLGLISAFWVWWSKQNKGPKIAGLGPSDLVYSVGGTEAFWKAVAKVNWIRIEEDGISVTAYDKWLSDAAKTRLGNTLRMQRYRQQKEGGSTEQPALEFGCNDFVITDPPTPVITNPLPRVRGRANNNNKKKKRQEENTSPVVDDPPKPPLPPPVAAEPPQPPHGSERFVRLWADWLAFRVERNLRCDTPTAAGTGATILRDLTEPDAYHLLRWTYENEWSNVRRSQLDRAKQEFAGGNTDKEAKQETPAEFNARIRREMGLG